MQRGGVVSVRAPSTCVWLNNSDVEADVAPEPQRSFGSTQLGAGRSMTTMQTAGVQLPWPALPCCEPLPVEFGCRSDGTEPLHFPF